MMVGLLEATKIKGNLFLHNSDYKEETLFYLHLEHLGMSIAALDLKTKN